MQTGAIEQFNELVDQLIFWSREHGGKITLPEKDKRRVRLIMSRIIGEHAEDDPYSDIEEAIHQGRTEMLKRKPNPTIVTALTNRTTGHVVGNSNDKSKQPQRPSSQVKITVRCEYCAAKVKKGRIKSHHGKCPKRPKDHQDVKIDTRQVSSHQRERKTAHPNQKKKSDNSHSKGDISGSAYAEDKRMDGSYGTHVYRDGGKFGSTPSYDDYSEESYF